MNHITLGMPVLVDVIAVDFDKLLEDGSLTSRTAHSKLCGVVIVAIHLPAVFIVGIVWAKHGRTY